MMHVMREDLVRWRDQGLPEDRERVLSHLATCTSCAATYAELVRTAPPVHAPEHFDPADFVKRGYAARRETTARTWWASVVSWKMWAGALIGVALVLLAVHTGFGPGPGSELTDATRGVAIEIVSPAGTTKPPTTVEWKSGITPARFRVELTDSMGTLVYRTDTDVPRAALPPEVTAKLLPGSSYACKITALDQDGRPITASSGTFSIAGATK
jgi:hypothetical protein